MITDSPSVATHCGIPLVSEFGGAPWCERCGWGLDTFEPLAGRGRLGRRVDRLAFRTGIRVHTGLHRELLGRPVDRPGTSAATLLLAIISAGLVAAMLLLIALGVWLIAGFAWPGKILGVILIGLALVLRPRLGRVKPALAHGDEITRAEAPTLFALIDRVAQRAGTPAPHRVVIDAEWNASAATYGLRRTRVLTLGLALFGTLRPQERVALLGHELGHYANGDPHRGLLTRPALENFDILAQLFYPDRDRFNDFPGLVSVFAEKMVQPVMFLLSYLFRLVHVGVNVVGARQSQRGEYFADELATRVAGSQAVLGLLDVLAASSGHVTVVGSRSRAGDGLAGWRIAVEEARERMAPRMARLRRITLRQGASVLASHPPAGLRHELISGRAPKAAEVVLGEAEAERIDRELAKFEQQARLSIANSW